MENKYDLDRYFVMNLLVVVILVLLSFQPSILVEKIGIVEKTSLIIVTLLLGISIYLQYFHGKLG